MINLALHFMKNEKKKRKKKECKTKELRIDWHFTYTDNNFKNLVVFIKKYRLLAIRHRSTTCDDKKTYPFPQQASFH